MNVNLERYLASVREFIEIVSSRGDEPTAFQARVNELNRVVKSGDVGAAMAQWADLVDAARDATDCPPYIWKSLTWAQDKINELLPSQGDDEPAPPKAADLAAPPLLEPTGTFHGQTPVTTDPVSH